MNREDIESLSDEEVKKKLIELYNNLKADSESGMENMGLSAKMVFKKKRDGEVLEEKSVDI